MSASSSSSNPTSISPPPYQPPKTSNLAILIFLTSPLIAFLPPRKLDIYTFCLSSAFVLSAGHIYASDSPTSSRLRHFISSRHKQSPPHNNDKKRSTAAAAAQEVEKDDGDRGQDLEEGGGGVKAMAKQLWMGNETVGWEKRRVAREREVLDEGGGVGYGELIGESILDILGGKRKDEEEGKAE